MSLPQTFGHLLNFVAPALWMALGMLLLGHVIAPGPRRMAWPGRLAVHVLVGVVVLVAGLVLSGQDGSMLTWAALVLALASSEWALRR
jgi:4-hydroxybenzoate polyprenyltransferase